MAILTRLAPPHGRGAALRTLAGLAFVALTVAPGQTATAQVITATEVKAALLFNFARFTIWPDAVLGTSAALEACIIDAPVADALEALGNRESIHGRKLLVRRIKRGDAVAGCHMLYESGMDTWRVRMLVQETAGAAILTMSDSPEFAELGGVANFYVEHDKVRFAVNPLAAERAHLRISSRLLSLAKVVKDGPSAGVR